QVMLVRLLDQLYFYKDFQVSSNRIMDMYDAISTDVKKTLHFIKDLFGDYFDRNEKPSVVYLELYLKELCNQLEQLKKVNESSGTHVRKVTNILITNFDKFCARKGNAATYNELRYQKELMNQLLTTETLSSENLIKQALFYFNYNDDNYIAYLIEKLKQLTKSLPNKKEKIAALFFEKKIFNQLPTRPTCHLLSDMPSLKEQLNHWIEEEVEFLEKDSEAFSSQIILPTKKEEVYVHVPFKGTEIYLVHKAFIDSGGAPAETYKSLFEKTASHLTNKNTKGFSLESLQKNSDKVDYVAKDNVKRFLQKMIRNIDSY
ncbi:MAG TPA: hypothetical protein VIQ00_05415, partial [Chitinophagaceae bacterium]